MTSLGPSGSPSPPAPLTVASRLKGAAWVPLPPAGASRSTNQTRPATVNVTVPLPVRAAPSVMT